MKISTTEALAFINFYKSVQDKPMTLKLAYKLSKINNELQSFIDWYNKEWRSIYDKYVELDAEGKPIELDGGASLKVKEGLEKECNDKMEELLNFEDDFSIEKYIINIDEVEGLETTPRELKLIEKFIF